MYYCVKTASAVAQSVRVFAMHAEMMDVQIATARHIPFNKVVTAPQPYAWQ